MNHDLILKMLKDEKRKLDDQLRYVIYLISEKEEGIREATMEKVRLEAEIDQLASEINSMEGH
jgi:hypothetical protein